MQIIHSIDIFRNARRSLEGSVAFVPTMGYLHDGHLSLMHEAKKRCENLVVSIYVNPTQFAPGEDLDTYPRDPEGDAEKCRQAGCDILFMPDSREIYTPDHNTFVRVDGLRHVLCAPSRPDHFDGVTTIVTKFFNIVAPDIALFGEKDYQQLALIKKMTRELNFGIEIIGCPTVRERDGLAMSSRNRYLNTEQRQQATQLFQALSLAWKTFQNGNHNALELIDITTHYLRHENIHIDYVECVHPDKLTRFSSESPTINPLQGAVLAVAAFVGSARLIDNIRLDAPLPTLNPTEFSNA